MNPTVAQFYHPDILTEACRRFDIEAPKAELIQANSNIIFDCGDKILRLTHSVVRPRHEVALEVAWLLDLAQRQLPVTLVLKSINGHYLEKIGAQDHFSVVCFEKVMGQKATVEEWNEELFERLGQFTAKLHHAGKEFLQSIELVYPLWNEIPEHHCEAYLVVSGYDFQELYRKIIQLLNDRPPGEMGLIHYDIHLSNFFLCGPAREIVLFDFEMCCQGRLMDDIATVLYYASRHPASKKVPDFEAVFYRAFKTGYEKVYPINTNEEAYLTHYLLYRDLMVLGFVHKAWGPTPWDKRNTAYREMLLRSIIKRRKLLGI